MALQAARPPGSLIPKEAQSCWLWDLGLWSGRGYISVLSHQFGTIGYSSHRKRPPHLEARQGQRLTETRVSFFIFLPKETGNSVFPVKAPDFRVWRCGFSVTRTGPAPATGARTLYWKKLDEFPELSTDQEPKPANKQDPRGTRPAIARSQSQGLGVLMPWPLTATSLAATGLSHQRHVENVVRGRQTQATRPRACSLHPHEERVEGHAQSARV